MTLLWIALALVAAYVLSLKSDLNDLRNSIPVIQDFTEKGGDRGRNDLDKSRPR